MSQYLVDLVEAEIREHIEPAEWHEQQTEVEDIQQRIREVAKDFQ